MGDAAFERLTIQSLDALADLVQPHGQWIISPDAPIAVVGERKMLNFSKEQKPDVDKGVHFCLFTQRSDPIAVGRCRIFLQTCRPAPAVMFFLIAKSL